MAKHQRPGSDQGLLRHRRLLALQLRHLHSSHRLRHCPGQAFLPQVLLLLVVGLAKLEVHFNSTIFLLPLHPFPFTFFKLSMVCVSNSTLGQGLLTSTYPGEIIFSILIAISGLLLFALLIGNMQVSKIRSLPSLNSIGNIY